MTKTEKPFDAVRMMRAIRDELDEQLRGMTFAEEQAFLRGRLHSRSTGGSHASFVAARNHESGAGTS